MLWFRKSEAPATQAVVEMPRSHKRAVSSIGSADEIEGYVALCEEIKAVTPAVRMLQLRHFLAERGIPEYDASEVDAYLFAIAAAARKLAGDWDLWNISWCPLREEDKGVCFRWVRERGIEQGVRVQRETDLYHRLVPASVLSTVQTISKEFPDAKFFVSEISRVADPFLAVTFPGQTLLIVDFWAEPGFRPVTK